jgi:hypothetical protein
MTAAIPPFLTEARDLSDDEHCALTRELEEMRAERCDAPTVFWWMRDNKWDDDPGYYFEAHKLHFLKEARAMFAEGLAA